MPRSRPPRPILLRVESPIVHPVAAKAGDRLLIRPGTDEPVILIRDAVPNYGALLGHLVGGALSADDPDEARELLGALLTQSAPPPGRRGQRRRSA